jgi:hypothetical protein
MEHRRYVFPSKTKAPINLDAGFRREVPWQYRIADADIRWRGIDDRLDMEARYNKLSCH